MESSSESPSSPKRKAACLSRAFAARPRSAFLAASAAALAAAFDLAFAFAFAFGAASPSAFACLWAAFALGFAAAAADSAAISSLLFLSLSLSAASASLIEATAASFSLISSRILAFFALMMTAAFEKISFSRSSLCFVAVSTLARTSESRLSRETMRRVSVPCSFVRRFWSSVERRKISATPSAVGMARKTIPLSTVRLTRIARSPPVPPSSCVTSTMQESRRAEKFSLQFLFAPLLVKASTSRSFTAASEPCMSSLKSPRQMSPWKNLPPKKKMQLPKVSSASERSSTHWLHRRTSCPSNT
mmetsp:Transcript_4994/g.9990  ORF Transcript_4994/g.9990 Transcript_4994/m.9990 type:complete len:303 (+) Transcript_4994:444-1352(+)